MIRGDLVSAANENSPLAAKTNSIYVFISAFTHEILISFLMWF